MFRSTREDVTTALADALEVLSLSSEDLGLERPPEGVDAILASNVAFRLASEAGAPPVEVAASIAGELDADAIDHVGHIECEGPYINFYPADSYFQETLVGAMDENYGYLPDRNESLVIEHTSANPTGPVHVGRARNPIIGDAIARILDVAGYDVETHYYVNDAGRQVATFTWAYETFDEAALPEPDRDKPEYDLVRYYRKGTTFLEEGPEAEVEDAEAEIAAIMQGIEDGDQETIDRVHAVVDQVLGGMCSTIERLPATFDRFVKETQFIVDGATDDVIDSLRGTDHAQQTDDGAWELDLTPFGFEKNLVFVRSDGTSLYTTRDIAYHQWKLDEFDRAVTVLGEDHELQARQLTQTLELLGADTDRLDSIHYSWVNLPEGSMSTREGTGINLDDLLDEAIERAREEVQVRLDDRIRDDDLTEDDIERIAHQVGIGAVRYDIVAKQPTKQITFEWDRALDFEAQSAPYIQYAHARCCGILDEVAEAGVDIPDAAAVDADALETDAAQDLLRTIALFPVIIEEAADGLEPHTVATYCRRIADDTNTFYRECPVLDAEGATQKARIGAVQAARTTLANALSVLGIEAPASM